MRVDRYPRRRLETRTTLFASVKPSPNLPNDQAIALYPSLCPFEGTAISVGRGTLYPFQVIGSPDIRISSFSFRPGSLGGFLIVIPCITQYCDGNNLRHITAPKGFSLNTSSPIIKLIKTLELTKFFTCPQWFEPCPEGNAAQQQITKGASERRNPVQDGRMNWKPTKR